MRTVPLRSYLKKRFKALYPNRRLLAVRLDGFTHKVFYDRGGIGTPLEIDTFSHCMPEGNWSERAKEFFKEIGNAGYQNNAREIVFTYPKSR